MSKKFEEAMIKKKRLSIIILLLLIVLCTSSCSSAIRISLDDSKKIIEGHLQNLESILKSHDFKIISVKENPEHMSDDIKFSVEMHAKGDSSNYFITMQYFGQQQNFIIETVEKLQSKEDATKNINIDIFIELVNSLYNREITKEMCRDFLDPESTRYINNNDDYDEVIISKSKQIDFTEFDGFEYQLYRGYSDYFYYIDENDIFEQLSFLGELAYTE